MRRLLIPALLLGAAGISGAVDDPLGGAAVTGAGITVIRPGAETTPNGSPTGSRPGGSPGGGLSGPARVTGATPVPSGTPSGAGTEDDGEPNIPAPGSANADCAAGDITVPGGNIWAFVDAQNKQNGANPPQWLKCALSKTKVARTYEKLEDMEVAVGAHRAVRLESKGDAVAVGFTAYASGPVCWIASTPAGQFIGDLSPHESCRSLVWASASPGGSPLCWSVLDASSYNKLEVHTRALPASTRATWPHYCGLEAGKKYYCNIAMYGLNTTKDNCNTGLAATMPMMSQSR